MLNKAQWQAGMTLVELIVAIVIIAVGLAGVLSVFNSTVKNSADPMIRKQLLALAEGMMDEVMLLPFEAADPTTNWSGSATCANRDQFDEVDDFSGYTNQDVCDYDGNQKLPGYKLSVAVESLALDEVPTTAARKITVTAQVGAESLSLVAWRTNWAQP